jgi:hypothetical protein
VYLPTPAARSSVLAGHPGARFRGSLQDHYLDAHGRLHKGKAEHQRHGTGAGQGGRDGEVDRDGDGGREDDRDGEGNGACGRDGNQRTVNGMQNSTAKDTCDKGSAAITAPLSVSMEQNGHETALCPTRASACSKPQVVEANGQEVSAKHCTSMSSANHNCSSCSPHINGEFTLRIGPVPVIHPKKGWKWGTSQVESQDRD